MKDRVLSEQGGAAYAAGVMGVIGFCKKVGLVVNRALAPTGDENGPEAQISRRDAEIAKRGTSPGSPPTCA